MSERETTEDRTPDFTDPADYETGAEFNTRGLPHVEDFEEYAERQSLLDKASSEDVAIMFNGSPRDLLALLHSAIKDRTLDPDLAREVIDHADGSQWDPFSEISDPEEIGEREWQS